MRRAQPRSMMPRSGTGVAGAQRHGRRRARRNADRRRGRPASGLAVESGDSGALQRLFEIAQPVASPFDVNYVRPVQQAVEDGGGKDLVAGQQFRPVAHALVGGVLSQIFGRDEQGPARRIKSSGERIELLRGTQFARGLQLTFADHVHELNAREGDGG